MNIVFAADHNYIRHLSVAILSLLTNNKNSYFNIYIINIDITLEEWLLLVGLDKLKQNYFFDVKINAGELDELVTNFHFSKANYYRLFIPETVPYDKALYIDADVVIKGDINELWDIVIDDVFLAAVEDVGFDRHNDLEMNPNSKYFNSGVMLLNLKKWREVSVKSKVIEFVKRKPDAIHFVDQCGLNAVIDGHWKPAHPKFNMQSIFLEISSYGAGKINMKNIEIAIKSPVIIHYTGSSKPWHFLNTHPYKNEYWRYRKLTPYKRSISEELTALNISKWLLPKSLKGLLKFIFIRFCK